MKTLASLLAMIAFDPACSKKDAAPKKHVASPDYCGELPDFDLAAIVLQDGECQVGGPPLEAGKAKLASR